jgi:hypothetical protein
MGRAKHTVERQRDKVCEPRKAPNPVLRRWGLKTGPFRPTVEGRASGEFRRPHPTVRINHLIHSFE